MKNLKLNKILWGMASILSVTVSVVGLLRPYMYNSVEPANLIPGTLAQDFMTIPAGLILLFLAFKTEQDEYKKQIIAIGLTAYLFYGYGLYVIGQVFTPLYIVYMAIFTISFYSLVFGLINIEKEKLNKLSLSDRLRKVSVVFSFLQPLVFYPLWIMMLLTQINNGKRVDFISVFVIDLCFVMPAFIITAILAKRKNPFSYFILPALNIMAFVELAPLGVGELIKPKYNLTVDPFFLILFSILSLLFLLLGILDLRNLKSGK